MRRPDLGSQVRDQLILVDSLRAFAGRLGLDTSSSYTRYFDTGGQPISWNVSASPPDRFAPYLWHFPIVGALPYKGFFTETKAREEQDYLRRQGLDVLLSPVPAYSTLGFFSDPVLSTMLDYPEDRLADLILHELTHATVFAKGQADFDESLATYIGQAGTLAFLAERHGPDTPLIQQTLLRRADEERFQTFVDELSASLDSLYSQGLPRPVVREKRLEVFARAQERFRLLQPQFHIARYDWFLKWEVNNALLLSFRRYRRDLEVFARIHRLKGGHLDQALAVFVSCGHTADPWACLRDSAAALALTSAPADPRR